MILEQHGYLGEVSAANHGWKGGITKRGPAADLKITSYLRRSKMEITEKSSTSESSMLTDIVLVENKKSKNTEEDKMENYHESTNQEALVNMKIESVAVESLVVPPHHPRKFSGELKSLEESIRKEGLNEPLLVSEAADNQFEVIDGSRRLEVAKEFGWKSVPCLIKKGLKDPDLAHLSYVKNMERKNLNPVEIAEHIKSMMGHFGYTLREMEIKGYGSPAKISNHLKLLELPEPVRDDIQNGKLTATHGLALAKLPTDKEQKKMAKQVQDLDLTAKRTERRIDRYLKKGKKKKVELKAPIPKTDVPGVYFKDSSDMSELPDKSVHLIVTSPPYGIGKEYEVGLTYNDLLDNVRGVMNECARVLVPGGIMALNVCDILNFKGKTGKSDVVQIQLMGHIYQTVLRRHQIYLTDQIIWQKSLPWANRKHVSYNERTVHTSYRLLDNFEPVYIFRKNGERELPDEENRMKSRLTEEQWTEWVQGIWKIQTVQKMNGHPAIFPDELAYRLVRMFSYEGDTVLDPFLGSGTTVKVARELNREGIGYERELQYKPVIMAKLGVAEEATSAGPMVEFAEQTADIGSLEQAVAKEEAVIGAELFKAAAEVQEPVTVG